VRWAFIGNTARGCNVEPVKAVGVVEPLNNDKPDAEHRTPNAERLMLDDRPTQA
jgi:hypothetical protein